MRIAQLIFGAEFAGAERHAIELAGALAERRHEVALIAPRRPADSAFEAALRRHLPASVPRIGLPLAWPGPALRLAVRRLRADIVHSHDHRASRYATRWTGRARRLATLHLGYSARDHGASDALVCLTGAQHEEAAGFAGRIATIGNWVVPHRRLSEAEIRGLRQELGASEETFLIGAVGRLTPVKGFDLLIRAFRNAGLPDCRLVILGEGPLHGTLASEGGPTVLLPGFRDDVRDCYQALDLFVCSSHSESYSLAVLEAMDAGLPIVCTTAAGVRADLGDAPVRWVPPGDVAALQEALRAMYAARPGRRNYPLERFALAGRVDAIEDLYGKLLSSPS